MPKRVHDIIYFQLGDDVLEFTPQEKRFCHEYVACNMNATQAVIKAGYSIKGARQRGSELLTKVDIKKYVKHLQNDLAARCGITADMILKEMAKLGMSNIKKVVNENNQLRNLHEMDDDDTAAITSIEIEEIYEGRGADRQLIGYNKKIKLSDKQRSLEGINRMLGFNKPDKIAETDPEGKPIQKSKIKLSNGDEIDLS
jgi:phage terminase small subunit